MKVEQFWVVRMGKKRGKGMYVIDDFTYKGVTSWTISSRQKDARWYWYVEQARNAAKEIGDARVVILKGVL